MKLHTLTNGTITIKVGADTVERAIAKCSSLDQWQHVSTEEVPYVHGPAMEAIAEALGTDWKAEPTSDEHPDCNFWLVREDGLKLYSNNPDRYGQKGRWTFGLVLPYGYHYNRIAPVNIGATKTPAQIATGIRNRLLPQAEAAFTKTQNQIEAEQKQVTAQKEVFDHLVEFLGRKATGSNANSRQIYFQGGRVEVMAGGRITLEFSGVSLQAAKSVLSGL